MKCKGVLDGSLKRIHSRETTSCRIKIARPQVVEAQIRVVLLSGVEVDIRCRSGLADEVAESVVVVAVSDGASRVHQEADASVSIVAVKANAGGLILADAAEAISVEALD